MSSFPKGRSHPRRAGGGLIRLGVFFLAVLLLAVLFVLLITGLPENLTRHVCRQVQASGIPLHFDQIRLSTRGRGWVLGNARVYSRSPDALQPVLSVRKLYVHAWPVRWQQLRPTEWRVHLFAKDAVFCPAELSGKAVPAAHPIRRVKRFSASLSADRHQMRLYRFELDWARLRFRASGALRFPDVPVERQPLVMDWDWAIREFSRLSESLRLEGEPEIQVRIDADMGALRQADLSVQVHADGFHWADDPYGPVSLDVRYQNEKPILERLVLIQPDGGRLGVYGTFDLDTRDVVLHFSSTLSTADFERWVPPLATEWLERYQISISGRPQVRGVLGPAVPERLLEQADMSVDGLRVRVEDRLFDPLSFRMVRRGDWVEFTEVDTRMDDGPLTGWFRIHINERSWSAAVQARCNPDIAGLFDEDLDEFIGRLDFPAAFPDIRLELSQSAPGASLELLGTVDMEQVVWSGVPIEQAKAALLYTNRVLRLEPLFLSRQDERFEGAVEVRFPEKLAWFDVRTSFPPADIAQICAPDDPGFIQDFKFTGPLEAEGRGVVDYGPGTRHAFDADIRGTGIGWEQINAGRFNAKVAGRGEKIHVDGQAHDLWGGLMTAQVEFMLPRERERLPYQAEIHLEGVDFSRWIREYFEQDPRRTHGTLSGHAKFQADAAMEFWKSVQGSGRIDLLDGHLADLPFFGGFTRLVQIYLPAFRFFSLTSLTGDFLLEDGAVYSRNAVLEGSLFSAIGKGRWSLEDGLDFTVRAEPLRQTRDAKSWYQVHLWAADAVKTGTAPLFWALEFRLTGPVGDPDWRLANLPRWVREAGE